LNPAEDWILLILKTHGQGLCRLPGQRDRDPGDNQTLACRTWLCPGSAFSVGVCAAERLREPGRPVICLATAHPAKFADAVREATGQEPALPPALADLHLLPSRCHVLPAEVVPVKDFVAAHAI